MIINYNVTNADAGPCDRCGARTEIRQVKPGRKPYCRYLLVWSNCTNRKCGAGKEILTTRPQTCQ